MKLVCRNESCKKYGIVDEYYSTTYRMVNGKLQSDDAPCPCCGKVREELEEKTPLSEKNIEMGKYSSASMEQKREMLKKRSHDHFEKEVKPFKEHQLHEAVKQFKNL